MNILIYSKDNCSFCEKAKTLCKIKNLKYTETRLGEHITREDFLSLFPDQRTLPLIFVNDEKIGGYNEFESYLARQTSN